jgi:ligand-binding sensor domain-containing protein
MHSDMPSLKGLQEIETINLYPGNQTQKRTLDLCNHQFLYVLKKKGGRAEYMSDLWMLTPATTTSAAETRCYLKTARVNVWVGLYGGVIKVTPEDEIVAVTDLPAVTDMTEDADGTIWLASEQVGLCRLTPAGLGYKTTMYDKYTEGLNTSNVQSVAAHPSGLIWIGTKEGRVITYNKNKGLFVDVSHLCAMTGEGILNMLTDNWNNVWISTQQEGDALQSKNRNLNHLQRVR